MGNHVRLITVDESDAYLSLCSSPPHHYLRALTLCMNIIAVKLIGNYAMSLMLLLLLFV